MSTFNGLMDLIVDTDSNKITATNSSDYSNNGKINSDIIEQPIKNIKAKPFDLQYFCNEIREKSIKDNKAYHAYASNISGYSIASECIGTTVLKILSYPVEDFSNSWLPLIMRSCLGKSVHDVIQENSDQFTEQECSMKIPSIRTSVRLDGLIGNNVLVEIKSCTYDDYRKILKSQAPRTADFYQCMFYKYIIENYLEECQKQTNTRTPPPALNKYDIDTLQFIYVAHDIMASDVESFSECVKIVKDVKKMLKSKHNQFFYMTSVVLNIEDFDTTPYMDFIKRKVERINYYIDNNKIPTQDDEFIDTKKCFFCLYYKSCPIFNN